MVFSFKQIIIFKLNVVSVQDRKIFLFKCQFLMVFFLVLKVSPDMFDLRVTDGERTITLLPSEFLLCQF